MPPAIASLLQLAVEGVAAVKASAKRAKQTLLSRVRDARKKAEETGDTSQLESIRDDLGAHR